MSIIRKLSSVIPIGGLLTVLFILICWSSVVLVGHENPINTFYQIFSGAFGTPEKTFAVLNKFFIFILPALAYCIPAWAGMYNIGGDGQLVLGGFAAALIGLYFQSNIALVNILAALVAAAAAGSLWALWPALLRVKMGVSEIVTTLLSNYVIVNFTEYWVNYPLRSKGSSVPRADYIPDNFHFPNLLPGFSATILIAVAAVIIAELYRKNSIKGYQYRVTGGNELFAQQGGIDIDKVRVGSMLVGGACAGLTGGLLVLSLNFTYMANFSADYGFIGLLIALIAGGLPITVFIITILFAALQVGAISMQIFTSLPSEITGVLQSTMVLIIAARQFWNTKKVHGRGGRYEYV